MAQFNPAMLVPADQVEAFQKGAGQARTTKQVALANIARQIELLSDAKIEGRRTFEVAGNLAKFSIRVNNTALVLETIKRSDATAEVSEMSVPAANLKDAFQHYAKRIEAGDFDAQLATLDMKRTARTEKMRTTRAAKKAEKPTAK